jgi:hypothetical protein
MTIDRDAIETAREILKQVLAGQPGQLGARLPAILNLEMAKRGLPPFEWRAHGFRKFIDFLEAQADLVEIDRPDGPGDVVVRFRKDSSSIERPPVRPDTRIHLRREIWQAFANPDPNRARFFELKTGRVVHFTPQDELAGAMRDQVIAAPEDFLEISPIKPEVHKKWMREFVERSAVPDYLRESLVTLLEQPYDGDLNVKFQELLGDQGPRWRGTRTRAIIEHVRDWARDNKIGFDGLIDTSPYPSQISSFARSDVTARGSAHGYVLALLGELTDNEIDELVLPVVSAVVRTLRYKRR